MRGRPELRSPAEREESGRGRRNEGRSSTRLYRVGEARNEGGASNYVRRGGGRERKKSYWPAEEKREEGGDEDGAAWGRGKKAGKKREKLGELQASCGAYSQAPLVMCVQLAHQ